jgi:uncharacterized membrane protein YqhA
MRRVFGFTRFLVIMGVVSSLVLAVVLFIASLIEAIYVVLELVTVIGRRDGAVTNAAVMAIQITDEILIAAALYIIAAGLYELFIGKANLPAWLAVRTFDDLKERLMSVSAAVLVVTFVEIVAVAEQGANLIVPGLAIAAVVISVGIFTYLSHRARGGGDAS